LLYFLQLGTFGFGGPIVLAAHMERDLVHERRWITAEDFSEGFALAQLAPGPLAAQLAIYLGWVRAGIAGATLVGLVFIAPSFLMVVILAALYVRFGGIAWIAGAFYGVGAAVIAIIAQSGIKLVRNTVGRDRLLWLLFAASAAVTAWTESEIVWLFILAGVLSMLLKVLPSSVRGPGTAAALAWPAWLASGLTAPASVAILWKLLWYFAAAGLFDFGSGLAIVPFLHGGVVQQYHWLTERQFLDAAAVSLITPGPVVITVAFIGFLVAGLAGAVFAAIGVFMPVYLAVVIVAPHFRRVAAHRGVRAFVNGVTAAAAGAIAGAAIVLGRRALIDVPTILISLGALALLAAFKRRMPEPAVILAAALIGIALRTRL
jgi:chromate transporter